MSKLSCGSFATRLRSSVLYSLRACLVLAATSTLGFAQAGQLDRTFANQGIFSVNCAGSTCAATAVALQSDGKIVAAGTLGNPNSTQSRGLVLRLNTDGSLDTSFGVGGSVAIKFGDLFNQVAVLVIQTDGKL